MSDLQYPSSLGNRASRRSFEFSRTYVVWPKGKHQATIVWLHGLGDNGSSLSQQFHSMSLPNIKLIFPTARLVGLLGGFSCTEWFDVRESLEDSPDDWEGLDASAVHIANLLLTEPVNVKVDIGGFSMGAATALYSVTCFALGKYANEYPYPINLRAVIGLNGWLPGSRSLRNRIETSNDAARKAASLLIYICHVTNDDMVAYAYGDVVPVLEFSRVSIPSCSNSTTAEYQVFLHFLNCLTRRDRRKRPK